MMLILGSRIAHTRESRQAINKSVYPIIQIRCGNKIILCDIVDDGVAFRFCWIWGF